MIAVLNRLDDFLFWNRAFLLPEDVGHDNIVSIGEKIENSDLPFIFQTQFVDAVF